MAKPTAKYWAERFERLTDTILETSSRSVNEIDHLYGLAIQRITDDLAKWYQKIMLNEGVTYQGARKLLDNNQLKEFKWTLKEYIAAAKKNGLDPKWQRQLENASAKVHISRLEALQTQIRQHLEQLYTGREKNTVAALKSAFTDGYYRTGYEVDKALGVATEFPLLDTAKIEKVLSKPWTYDDKTFSDRIWQNKLSLIAAVQQEMGIAAVRGDDYKTASANLAKRLNADKSNAARLVMTESAFMAEAARNECMKDLGCEEYQVVATLDRKTSPICRNMDGKHFPIAQFKPGTTAPPFHCWCRSCTAPYFDDEAEYGGVRVARDENGDTYHVPATMTYKEWVAQHGKSASKFSGNTGKRKPVLSQEEKQSIMRYIGSDAYKINDKLRNGAKLTPNETEFIENLDRALEKVPVYSGDVSRSVWFANNEQLKDFIDSFEVGTKRTFKEFLSTTAGEIYNPDAQVQIFVFDSKKGRNLTEYNKEEQEVLYQRGTEFAVVKKDEVDGRWFILLKETEDEKQAVSK